MYVGMRQRNARFNITLQKTIHLVVPGKGRFSFFGCFLLLLSLFLVNCSKENAMRKLFCPVGIFHTQEICVDMLNCPASFSAICLVVIYLQKNTSGLYIINNPSKSNVEP